MLNYSIIIQTPQRYDMQFSILPEVAAYSRNPFPNNDPYYHRSDWYSVVITQTTGKETVDGHRMDSLDDVNLRVLADDM
jgi:hypothetical protein